MKKSLILIGGGGHCRSCIDVIEAEGKFKIAGIVDMPGKIGQKVLGHEITACDKDLKALAGRYGYFLVTIGQIKSPEKRVLAFERMKKFGAKFPVIVSPLAYVSRHARMGEGTIVMHNAFVNALAKIGNNCIINTGAVIEHDSAIGDHCHISTESIVNGECSVGERTFIGSNTVLANNISITKDAVIAAGLVVRKSIAKGGIYKR